MKIFSFFAGAGFLDLGFEHAGYNVVFVNENHKPFINAYKYSRSKLKLHAPKYGYSEESIEYYSSPLGSKTLTGYVQDAQRNDLVGFIGGPPCPDFSVGGKNRGQHGDNGCLSKVYVDLIISQKPDFFLFENVKGLWRTKKHREFYESLKTTLQTHGYVLNDKLINAIHYGTPQYRERIILMGVKKGLVGSKQRDFPWESFVTHPSVPLKANIDWPGVNEFKENSHLPIPDNIRKELTVQYWFDKNSVDNHPNANHYFQPKAALSKFKVIAEGDDSKKSFKRIHRWRYSPTACYGNNEVHLHPYKARRLSVAEALAIQSLPKEFELPPSMTLSNMFKTIGNGVPYMAAKALASSLKQFLEENVRENEKANSRKFG